MTAVTKTLTFSSLSDSNPATPPAGYSKPSGSDNARIGLGLFYLAGATETIWVDNTILSGTTIYSRVTLPATVDGAAAGCCIIDSSGNGYEVITGTTNNNFRVFAVTNGKLSGGALATFAVAPLANSTVELSHTGTTLTVKQNSSTVGTLTTITRPTNPMAGAVSRGGKLASLQSEYDAPYSIDTLTSPLVPNASFSGTCTGFSNGAATLSFGGVSVAVTIASGAFSGTVPMIADNIAWPKLPATSQTITLTQSSNTATITRNISLPTGYETVRDSGSAVANFAGIISDDTTYLQYWFNAAGNPLTINDTAVFPTSGSYLIGQDTSVSANTSSLPRTDVIYIYRGASGKYFEHTVVLTQASITSVRRTLKNTLKRALKGVLKGML